MSNMVKLADVCLKITDGSHYSPEGVETGYPMLSVKDMSEYGFVYNDCKYISEEEFTNMKANGCVPELNDILIAKDGSYLKHVFVINKEKEEAVLSSIGILRPNTNLVNPYYIKYYLSSSFVKNQVAKKYVSGSALPRIILKNFANIELPMVNRNIQDKIVSVIKTIDDKIQNNNKISALLEEQAKVIYDYWFTQFDFPDENGKPYKSSGGKMVWNEELKREIPDGWEVKKIKKCITHINTGLNPRQNFVLGNGNIKYITVKNLTTSGSIDWTTCDAIDEAAQIKVHERSDISVGDILFASIAPLGRCALITEEPKSWDINESVFSIRPNTEVISPEYLYIYLMSKEFIKKAEHSSTGSVFAGIRISTLEDIPIVIPPKRTLHGYTHISSKLLKTKYKNDAENRELSSLRDFLLPLLMNGQCTIEE